MAAIAIPMVAPSPKPTQKVSSKSINAIIVFIINATIPSTKYPSTRQLQTTPNMQ